MSKNNKKYQDKIVDVLIDGQNKEGKFLAKTQGYKTVIINHQNKQNLIGKFAKVKIKILRGFAFEGDLESYEK